MRFARIRRHYVGMYITRLARLSACFALYFVFVCPALGIGLTISAAISMKDGLTDAGSIFEKQTGDHLTFNFLASGPLMKQIEEGAPVDVFVSAAHKQMDELKSQNLIDPATEQVVARGELVLIVPSAEKDPPTSFRELSGPNCKRIAIGEPKSVPAGDYAMQTLKSLNLLGDLASRLQTATNVRQVLDYVERGEVDAGLVYRTDAFAGGDKVKIVAVADESTHQPIEYPAAVIKSSKEHEQAERFLKFLSSTQGQEALARHGFLTVNQAR